MSDPRTHTATEQSGEQSEHEHVAEMLRAVDVRAPERLHRRVREMVASEEPTGRVTDDGGRGSFGTAGRGIARGAFGGRLKPTFAAMAVAAVAGAAIALLSGGVTRPPQGPSVSAASELALSAATTGAPGESATHSNQLNVAVDGVAFPYWKERFGWRATGTRTDTIGGRKITTVYYSGPGATRIGYAIVAGTPAPTENGGTIAWRGDVAYRLLHVHGAPVVTWRRNGRLCVLSGRGVSEATLVRLASWGEGAGSTVA